VLLAVGMLGWVLCSPVLPIPHDKHVRAVSIALAEMFFLVGVGCLSARRAGLTPTALRRRLCDGYPAPAIRELVLAAVAAAAISILGTRIAQFIVVKATWSASLAATTPASIKQAGKMAFETFKAHPIAVGIGFPIIEEIHFRLFLMTALAWIVAVFWSDLPNGLSKKAWWVVIVIQGIAFGALHAATGQGTLWWEPRDVQMLLEPRSVAGVVLGYTYWRWGLETTILAHLIADLSVLCFLMLMHGG
jgi:membrane protease YdiL (CAAX protease family)